ncbi:hypothetical protein SS50377_24402 [Spironucleus salmonicida]|uniref:Uncharacterized protein n=1 Tax=Spironucleus salmonicida TaxID=348837 RepID=V6LP82_9EUKA|nr:hypothetical protein SS50377_24402 [Spironucleus salmonicida]|eukprot:EST46048.1 Hypothetical protein SS50377_14038 [Spironucleus salmonicida]
MQNKNHLSDFLLQLIFDVPAVNNSHYQIGFNMGMRIAIFISASLKYPQNDNELTSFASSILQQLDPAKSVLIVFIEDKTEVNRYSTAFKSLPIYSTLDAQQQLIFATFLTGILDGSLYQFRVTANAQFQQKGADFQFNVNLNE